MSYKFQFEITEEQQRRAMKIFSEYGMRKAVMSKLLDEVMDIIETHGYAVVGVLLDKGTQMKDVIPSLRKGVKND
jgi:hypothetical protein